MHLRATNKSAKTLDVHRFCFEFTSALEFINEHSGLAVQPAHLYLLRRTQACMSQTVIYSKGIPMNTMTIQPYAAFVGIDWADTKHDICIQAADSLRREFVVIPHQVEEIDQWAQSLHKRFPGSIAIALELSKGS